MLSQLFEPQSQLFELNILPFSSFGGWPVQGQGQGY
jgi:hypothetical protein